MQADDFGPLAQAMAIAFAVSACVSGGLRAACPRRRSILGMWLLAAAAPALAVFAVPAWRVYSYHGCFHIAVVSRILEGSVPPENPVFAGAPLLYPWSYHLTAALISAALGISPSWAFALLGIASLLATVSLLYAFALRATGDHATAVL
ncbi:MAG: hypothetical protein QOD06_607, partial [Candidatus Binatota bacterium]|nr:hypothetical protein [Candidatus Binatota bacterium]